MAESGFITRARAGAIAKNAKAKIESDNRVSNLSFDFERLNLAEKRRRILLEQGGKCCMCGIDQFWNNSPLKFELDHINGTRQDNARDNLRLLCPNCHSQTPTYKVGNNKNPGKKQYTDMEIIEALYSNQSGYQAMKSLGMNPHGGNYTRIRKIIKNNDLQLDYTV